MSSPIFVLLGSFCSYRFEMRNIASLVLFLCAFCYNFDALASETSWIFRTDYEKHERANKIAAEIGAPQGGPFVVFATAQYKGDQKSFATTLEILRLDLEDELPFVIAKNIVCGRKFKDPSMKAQLAELEPVKRAVDIVQQKQKEREKIAEIYLATFPHKTYDWRLSDFYFVVQMFSDLRLLEKIQNAYYTLVKEGIVFPCLSYFTRALDISSPKPIVIESFLNDFWGNLKLRKLEIEKSLGEHRYSLLEGLLFEKETPSADKMSQLYKANLQNYSVLEKLLPKILEEAKKGNELCMETLCYLLRAYHRQHFDLISHESFVKFIRNVEGDKSLMESLVSYFKKDSLLDLQRLITWSWKYKDIVKSSETKADVQESSESHRPAKKQRRKTTPEEN